jgi:3-oxoacyl-[acyl-carrier protein] reductase
MPPAAAVGDDEASWDASLAVDLMAGVRASRFALPYLVKGRQPTIINIASGSGLNPSVRTPAYGASKAAIIHYTRTQAAALAMKGVRVNCVAPGSIEFPGGSWEQRKTTESALYNQVLASMPAGRLGRPEEVASVVLFLASPLAIWVTAQIIGVSGGQGFANEVESRAAPGRGALPRPRPNAPSRRWCASRRAPRGRARGSCASTAASR